MKNKTLGLTLFITLLATSLSAQYLAGLTAVWNDKFDEWELFTEDEQAGELRVKWALGDDWTEWDYRLGDYVGHIKQKWRNNPNQWEVRGDNEIISIQTVWNNDFREWRISDGRNQLKLKRKYSNVIDEWEVDSQELGFFEMFTQWDGDPREWNITDELDEGLSFPVKMGLVFIVMYHSLPR
ncbi:MAG: hypothetical protein HRU41_25025 [Saprospiraceae bacterium]|nr:hypothetical protein [Saprospiraceae bacterium]